jgi:hypothetical protein
LTIRAAQLITASKGAKAPVENFDLPLSVDGVGKVAFLKRKTLTINVSRRHSVEPANDPAIPEKFVDKVTPDLSGDPGNQDRAVRHRCLSA